jgi:hypothetical protein
MGLKHPKSIIRPASLILAFALVGATPPSIAGVTATPAIAHELGSTDQGDWPAYAKYLGVTIDDAKKDHALVEEAGALQESLEQDFGSEFAGLWIERDPTFRVVVALTSAGEAEVRSRAPEALGSVLDVRTVKYSLRDLRAAMAFLPMPDVPHAMGIEVRTNQIEIVALVGELDSVRAGLSGRVSDDLVKFTPTAKLPTPIDIYGGLLHETTCGGLEGTTGWSVKKNGSSTTGILTAAHLANCGTVSGYTLTFRDESEGGIADAQWFTSNTIESPKFRWSNPGGTRLVLAKRAYSAIVVGELICKWGRTSGYSCGEVEEKDFDVDGIFGPKSPVWIEIRNCGGDELAEPGDSGGPAFLNNTAVGILTNEGGDIFCGNKAYVNSWSHFQQPLSVTLMVSP